MSERNWHARGEAVHERWLWFYDAVGGTGDRDDMMTLALEMLAAAEAVVAVQREAITEVIAAKDAYMGAGSEGWRSWDSPTQAPKQRRYTAAVKALEHALDAEGVSEPVPIRLEMLDEVEIARRIVLAALDEIERRLRRAEGVSEPGRGVAGASAPRNVGRDEDESHPLPAAGQPGSLTSPVDTAPRGYVEHGPDGPQAVYHAETPDTYLAKGDRP